MTFLPVTVMSICLIEGVDGVEVRLTAGDEEGAEVCEGVEADADGSVDETGPAWEQDATTSAALRPRAAIKDPCCRVVFVTVGSLGGFV